MSFAHHLHEKSEIYARCKKLPDLVCNKEKSAPLSTALALFNASTSSARACLRMSKYFRSQSHSACKDAMYSSVALSRDVSSSALVDCFSVRDLESAARFSLES